MWQKEEETIHLLTKYDKGGFLPFFNTNYRNSHTFSESFCYLDYLFALPYSFVTEILNYVQFWTHTYWKVRYWTRIRPNVFKQRYLVLVFLPLRLSLKIGVNFFSKTESEK